MSLLGQMDPRVVQTLLNIVSDDDYSLDTNKDKTTEKINAIMNEDISPKEKSKKIQDTLNESTTLRENTNTVAVTKDQEKLYPSESNPFSTDTSSRDPFENAPEPQEEESALFTEGELDTVFQLEITEFSLKVDDEET